VIDAVFAVKATPSPQGQYSITSSGLFSYTPDPSDKQDIHLTFQITPRAGIPGQSESQTVTLVRWGTIAPETRLVSPAQAGSPDEERKDFLAVSESEERSIAPWFNGAPKRKLRDFTISGKTVVLETQHRNGLYERINCVPVDDPTKAAGQPNSDIGSVTIYAESVVIGAHSIYRVRNL
jgi:hypothetical protein